MRTRGGQSQGLQCSMGDTSREIGSGRGWRLPPLRRSGGGENRRGGRSQGLQCSRVLYESGGVCGGVHNTRPSGGAELQGRGPRNLTVGRDPSMQGDDQLRLSLRQSSRQPLLKFRGRVISAIRYSVGARVCLSVIPSIMIRAPRMVAVRGPGDE